jgi:hypothetical protein
MRFGHRASPRIIVSGISTAALAEIARKIAAACATDDEITGG